MPRLIVPTLALVAATAATQVHAGGGPGEVVLVVNADSAASLAVANAWLAGRGLDPGHVIALRGLSSHERIPVDEFRGRVLLPVICELERRGLSGQVQWVVYSADLPTAVDFGVDLTRRPPPPTIGRLGSITGLTVLAPLVIARNPDYCLSRAPNPMYRMCPTELGRNWGALPEAVQDRWAAASRRHVAKDYSGAIEILRPLADATGDPGIGYDLACALALGGDPVAAMAALERAERAGWNDPLHTQRDDDLASLREVPAFKAMIARLLAIVHPAPETLAWDRRLVRLPDGGPALAPRPVGGWLSASLAVTSGRGLSVRESLAVLARARSADATRPEGPVCLMRNGDVRSTTRQWAFSGVVAELQRMQVPAEIVDGVLPQQRSGITGLVAGSADFDWPASGSTLAAGAIAEHLTSCGGMMGWGDGQTPLTRFLRHGAAGATGAVEEPYALQFKFPSPFIQVHYRRGATLGEAVWASVANPYQMLLVGDPLCAPWAVPPRLRVESLLHEAGALAVSTVAEAGAPVAEVRLLVDGVLAWRGAPGEAALPTAGWPRGEHRLDVVAVAGGPLAAQSVQTFTVATSPAAAPGCAVSAAPLDGSLSFAVDAPAGTRTALVHLGRDLRVVAGGQARTIVVPAAELGLGRSQVRLEIRDQAGALLVRGGAVTVTVTEPAPLPASPEPAATVRGVRVIPYDQESPGVVVAKGRLDGGWLADALGAERARRPVKAGWWFRSDSADLTQIQIRALRTLRLSIDGSPTALGGGDGWRFGLVRLAPGWHRLSLELGEGEPGVEVRTGIAGTAPVAADACLSPAPAVAGADE